MSNNTNQNDGWFYTHGIFIMCTWHQSSPSVLMSTDDVRWLLCWEMT